MIREFLTGAFFGLGIWLLARGLFPSPVTLATKLARYSGTERRPVAGSSAFSSTRGRYALWLLRQVRGDLLHETEADVRISGGDLQAHAIDKLNAGVGGGVVVPVVFFLPGIARSIPFLVILGVIGFVVCYLLPDLELKRKAATRREEMTEALTGFLTLVSVSISGGGGVNSAMLDATGIGRSWCFDALSRALEESMLVGDPPWAGMERLGREFNVTSLVELASAMSLAGASGARVTETLKARAQSGRERELAEVKAAAEKKSESMSMPLATMLIGWILFLGYPAVTGLLGT